MPNRSSSTKRPRDINQLAAIIAELATEVERSTVEATDKNPHAAALGRLGGIKGGPARALKLSAERRREIAQKAAEARWHKEDESELGGGGLQE